KATAWLLGVALFWSKRPYDFFEAWIAAERIPDRTQTQFAVSWTALDLRDCCELFEGEVAFASPRIDQCQVLGKTRAVRPVFCERHQSRYPPAFTHGSFLYPASGVYNCQPRKRRRVVMCDRAVEFLLLRTSNSKGELRRNHVPLSARNYAFPEITT